VRPGIPGRLDGLGCGLRDELASGVVPIAGLNKRFGRLANISSHGRRIPVGDSEHTRKHENSFTFGITLFYRSGDPNAVACLTGRSQVRVLWRVV